MVNYGRDANRYEATQDAFTVNNIRAINQSGFMSRAQGFWNTITRNAPKNARTGLAAERGVARELQRDADIRDATGLPPSPYVQPRSAGAGMANDSANADSGDGILTRFIKGIYNEDKNGFQFGSIAGGVGGLALGGLMGSFIASSAGELGAGWLGTTAMVLLGGAGMMYGSQFVDSALTPSPLKPADIQVAAVSTGHAQASVAPAVDMSKAQAQVDADHKNKPTTKITDIQTPDAIMQTAAAIAKPETINAGKTA